MQVNKLRLGADSTFAPAGVYLARVALALQDANEREAARREALDLEDARLEARYRRHRAARSTQMLEAAH